MASPCYRLCQVLHGIVPPGLQNSSSAEPLVCVVVKGSTPAVTLLVPYAPWLCRWQAVTFTPRGLSGNSRVSALPHKAAVSYV